MKTSDVETHYRSCNICEAMCGIEIRVQLETGRKYAGVSVNDITDNSVTEELTASSVFFGVPVRIENRKVGAGLL